MKKIYYIAINRDNRRSECMGRLRYQAARLAGQRKESLYEP